MNYKVTINGESQVGKKSLKNFYGVKGDILTFDSNYGEIKLDLSCAIFRADDSTIVNIPKNIRYYKNNSIKFVVCINKSDLFPDIDLNFLVKLTSINDCILTSTIKEIANPFEVLIRQLSGKDDLKIIPEKRFKVAIVRNAGLH